MPPFRIQWRDEGRADVRRLDRATAMRLFEGIQHYAQTGAGNVAPLHGPLAGSFRLRLGDYRVMFTLENNTTFAIAVRPTADPGRCLLDEYWTEA